jgi:PAS domain S-box-containing protein
MRILTIPIVLLLMLIGAIQAPAQPGAQGSPASPHLRVLVLSDTRIMAPWYEASLDSFRHATSERHGIRVSLEWEPVNMDRYLDPAQHQAFLEEFALNHPGPEPDLVLTIQSAALFAFEQKERFFPTAPVVATLVTRSMIEGHELPQGATAVISRWRPEESVQTALGVFPNLERLVVVVGSSPSGLGLLATIQADLEPFADQLELQWLGGMPYEDVRGHLAALPRNSAALFVTFLRDSDGRSLEPYEVVADLSKTTSAPIFVIFATQLGTGVLGGMVLDPILEGQLAADQAALLLHGRPAPVRTLRAQPIFDWRVMQRFGLSRGDLPEGSIVRFEPTSMWEMHRNEILILAAAFLFLGLTAMALWLSILRRKRAEGELLRAHGLIEGITQGTEVLIAAEDSEFRYIYFNDAYRREFKKLWGRDIEVGTSMVEAMAPWPEERKKARDLWQRALKGESFGLVMDFGPSETEKHVYDLRFNPIHDAYGRRIGAAHFLRDISAQVRVQQELQESRARLEAALSSMTDSVFISDAEGRFVHTNEAFAIYHRFKDMDECSKKIAECPDTLEAFFADGTPAPPNMWAVPRALRGEVVTNTEYRLRRKDTGEEWVGSYSFAPIRNTDEEIIGSVVVSRDITEQKKAEQKLQQSHALFTAFSEVQHTILYAKDLQGRVIMASPSLLRMLGKEEPEVLGRTSREIYETGVGEDHMDFDRQVVESGVTETFEEIADTPHGRLIFLSVKSPYRDGSGNIVGLVGVSLDITRQKHLEEELRKAKEDAERLAAELEKRVQERTLELEQANRAKDEFLANMSHEIRTPVGEVIGMTDMLLQQEVPSPVRKDLEILRSSSDTILTLLNDLLDLSRIEQGKLGLTLRTFPLRETISAVARPFELMALEKGLEFEISIAGDVPEQVNCDPDRLGQVLKNLLSNALKFTDRGAIRLAVVLDKESRHLTRLRFSVSDTGIGIPEEKQPELFQSFSQLDPSYSKKFAGAGLGLAISRKLVELMGGEIAVRSTPGKGSCFSFTLSYQKVEEGSPEPVDPSIDPVGLGDLPSLKILLAEDNPVNRLFLRRALLTGGHRVDEAENGALALEKLQNGRFDLILMDIQMPVMDGVEATRLIRSGGHGRADIPIIALTAYAMKGDREKFLDNGMDGYVTKPVDFGELARVIAEVVTASS